MQVPDLWLSGGGNENGTKLLKIKRFLLQCQQLSESSNKKKRIPLPMQGRERHDSCTQRRGG